VLTALSQALRPRSGSYAAWRSGWKYGLSGPNQWREKVRGHSAVACDGGRVRVRVTVS